jgi:hypothetical protein
MELNHNAPHLMLQEPPHLKDGLAAHHISKFMSHSDSNQRLSLRSVACELAAQSGRVPSSASRYLGDRVSVFVFAGAAFHELQEASS